MIAGVADTHTALWYLFDDERLSVPAGDFIDQSAAVRRRIVVSAISLAEIVYLIEKSRLPANAYADLKNALADLDHALKGAPFTVEMTGAPAVIPPVPFRCARGDAYVPGVDTWVQGYSRWRWRALTRRSRTSSMSYPRGRWR